jgi:hypothetical protein
MLTRITIHHMAHVGPKCTVIPGNAMYCNMFALQAVNVVPHSLQDHGSKVGLGCECYKQYTTDAVFALQAANVAPSSPEEYGSEAGLGPPCFEEYGTDDSQAEDADMDECKDPTLINFSLSSSRGNNSYARSRVQHKIDAGVQYAPHSGTAYLSAWFAVELKKGHAHWSRVFFFFFFFFWRRKSLQDKVMQRQTSKSQA